jgi:hypothetical protein
MHPQDVEDRLRAVLKQLEGRRQSAKAALDEAWAQDPKAVDSLLSDLREAHGKYLEFSEVSERALPLLQTLSRIAQLRQEAIEHLDRLSKQAEESRKLKDSLRPEELQTMELVPPMVGESFDLSLLADEQVRMIREARAALEGGVVASQAPAPAAEPAPDPTPEAPATEPGQAPPPDAGPPSNPDATLDVTLEEWAAGQAEAEAPPVEALPEDEALDAMFEEAMTAEAEAGEASEPAPPSPEPAPPAPEPETPASPEPEAAAPAPPAPPEEDSAPTDGGVDPLDELLTRAGFE